MDLYKHSPSRSGDTEYVMEEEEAKTNVCTVLCKAHGNKQPPVSDSKIITEKVWILCPTVFFPLAPNCHRIKSQ